jgi:hypothetical protein
MPRHPQPGARAPRPRAAALGVPAPDWAPDRAPSRPGPFDPLGGGGLRRARAARARTCKGL